MRNNHLLTRIAIGVTVLALVVGVGMPMLRARAANVTNIFGYAWSYNTGWISMNSCTEAGGVVTCPPGVEYGVSVDPQTGDVAGYGWSSNIGWIDFAGGGDCPGGVAHVTWNPDGSGVWTGSIRAISPVISGANAAGWNGCIRMSGTGAVSHQVSIASDGQFSGYGWNANNSGGVTVGDSWVSWALVYMANPTPALDITLDSQWDSACSASNPITVSWTSTSVVPDSCTLSGAVTMSGQPAQATGVSLSVPAAPNINISITCDTVGGGTITDSLPALSCTECSDGIDNLDDDTAVDANDSGCMSCPSPNDPNAVSIYMPSDTSEAGSCLNAPTGPLGPRTTPIYEER